MPKTGRPRTRPRPAFGERLVRFREAAGLTQETFGAAVGLSHRMVAYWEGHAGRPPPADQLAAMARVLRITTDELLGLSDPPPDRHVLNRLLLRKLLVLEKLPQDARKIVFGVIDGLAAKHGIADELETSRLPHDEPPPDYPSRRGRRPPRATAKKPARSRR